MISVFVVDDHSVVIEGITTVLQAEKEIHVCGYATTAQQCIQYFLTNTADVILMDISLPDMDGIELCGIIKKKYPGVMVLALSTFNQGLYIKNILANGASGYLLKNADKIEIVNAIKTVVTGKQYLNFELQKTLSITNELMASAPKLTKREKEILILIADGFTNTLIAEKLFLSIDTIDSHRRNMYAKLKVNNTAQLIRYAIENKLV
jgi:DNA-binding NarL/FixJ family response regulator